MALDCGDIGGDLDDERGVKRKCGQREAQQERQCQSSSSELSPWDFNGWRLERLGLVVHASLGQITAVNICH